MARVYSTLFIVESLSLFVPGEYTVPDGMLAIVRDISGTIENITPGYGARLQVAQQGVSFYTVFAPPGLYATVHWEGRVAVPGSQMITAGIDQLDCECDLCVSGYLLSLP